MPSGRILPPLERVSRCGLELEWHGRIRPGKIDGSIGNDRLVANSRRVGDAAMSIEEFSGGSDKASHCRAAHETANICLR